MSVKKRDDDAVGGQSKGFTLIELLIVIAVLGILIALATFASCYIGDNARTKETTVTQGIVINAVDRWREVYHSSEYLDCPNRYPPYKSEQGLSQAQINDSGCKLVRFLTGNFIIEEKGSDVKDLISKGDATNDEDALKKAKNSIAGPIGKAANVIASLPTGAIKDVIKEVMIDGAPKKQTFQTLIDGFGREMRYFSQAGIGGRPVLNSAGADGVFGNTDDIRSD